MTEFLAVEGGTLAYEMSGRSGDLVVLAHGMGDSREAFRFLAPGLVESGYRVVSVDLRGCGESSARWDGYTRSDIAKDLLAVIEHVGAPAVLCGHSIAGGAATIAAATAPHAVTALVEIAPFTRKQSMSAGDLRDATFRRGMIRLLGATMLGSARQWLKYLDVAYPGARPADYDARALEISRMLAEPGRMGALKAMGKAAPVDAGEQLAHVRCPVLVVQGGEDPDWVDPQAEGQAILSDLPAGLGRLAMIEGAGHYPHIQRPAEVLAVMRDFLGDVRA